LHLTAASVRCLFLVRAAFYIWWAW